MCIYEIYRDKLNRKRVYTLVSLGHFSADIMISNDILKLVNHHLLHSS